MAVAAEGKAALRPFGEAPDTQVEYEEASSPSKDSKGRPAARAAIDGVTDATKPGQDVQAGQEKGGPQLGSGNAPLGEGLHLNRPEPTACGSLSLISHLQMNIKMRGSLRKAPDEG